LRKKLSPVVVFIFLITEYNKEEAEKVGNTMVTEMDEIVESIKKIVVSGSLTQEERQ